MKIKINREIEVPDSFLCASRGRECSALERIVREDGSVTDFARCMNFNDAVKWSSGVGFVKCRECIGATRDYLNGVTK